MLKRVFAAVLSLIVVLTLLPVSAVVQVRAAEQTEPEVEDLSDLGQLLAQASGQEQGTSPEEYPGGYDILELEVVKKVATVEYTALEDATVIVAIYTEDGLQMLASGNAPALAEETSVQVALTGSVPTYFRVAAYLVRTGDLSPLCESLESSRYTQDMQTLIKSTVKSYPADRVINLDGGDTTNFLVMQEGTVQIQSSETANRFVSIDRENKRYVIENADASVAGLQPGDTFVHVTAEGEWIIAKAETVAVEETTVTIQGAEVDIQEVFSHVKLEATGSVEDLEIDETTMGDNVKYLGITELDEGTGKPPVATRSSSGEVEVTKKIKVMSFELDLEAKAESGNVSVTAESEMQIWLGIELEHQFYYVGDYTYTENRAVPALFVEGKLEGEITGAMFKLPEVKWYPMIGVEVGFEPAFCAELSGEAEASITARYTSQLYYDEAAKGLRRSAPALNVLADSDVDGELFFGIDLNPTVEVLEGILFDADVTAMVGLFFSGEAKGTKHGDVSQPPEDGERPDELHSCEDCIAGEIHAGVKLGFEVDVAGADLVATGEFQLMYYKLADFYCCNTCTGVHATMGMGLCPERRFLVTAEALDAQGDPIPSRIVVATKDSEALEMGTTNENGVVSNYIPSGSYTFGVFGVSKTTESVLITGAGKVRIDGSNLFFSPTDPGSAISPILEKVLDAGELVASGSCGEDATWTITKGGLLEVRGTGAVTTADWKSQSVKPRVAIFHEGITELGDGLFSYESSLFSVSLPSTLQTIGGSTFYYTSITSVVIPNGVTKIGASAFGGCSDLVSVTFSDNLKELGDSAFYNCRSLDNVILPRGLTRVEDGTFSGCGALTEISVPNTVTVIGQRAFQSCQELSRITIYKQVTEIGDYAFYSTNLLNVQLEDTVRTLGSAAFAYCKNLQSIRLPSKMETIPNDLLSDCSSLLSISIPSTVTVIGARAFQGCAALTAVRIPDNVKEIENYAFSGCTNLETVSLPAQLEKLSERTFQECESLTAISIPHTVQQIEEGVFFGCKSLPSIGIPEGITKVSDQLFYGCTSLSSVDLPTTVTEIGNHAFYGCGFAELEIPGHINNLGWYAFANCANLESIVIPGTITQIPMYCFTECASLVSVDIPESVTQIGTAAFNECVSLRSIELPKNVDKIADFLFNGCIRLESVTVSQDVTDIGKAAFQYCASLTSFDIPETVTSIKSYAFYGSGLESVEIPEGVSALEDATFAKSENLHTAKLPSTVQTLDYDVFFGCVSLESVNIPQGIAEIPYRCFFDCASLKEIYLPDGLTSIGHYGFKGCTSLEDVRIPDSLQSFGDSAFSECSSLQEIYIPEGVTSIGDSAFIACESLSMVVIPKTVSYMGSFAFVGCDSMSVAYFEGDAPGALVRAWFAELEMTVYYPAGNATWTKEVMNSCETELITPKLTWVAYTPEVSQSAATANAAAMKAAAPAWVEEAEAAEQADLQAQEVMPVHNSVIGGSYTQEEIEGETVKTASFENLNPGQSYLMLAVANVEAAELLDPANLLYVTQVTADANGKVTQRYIQRTETELSFVMLCGAAEQDLKDATVTFPAMTAGEEEKAVSPIVEYNGKQLQEGVDYRIEGQASYTKAGTYTCTIRGIYNYIGTVECTYTVAEFLAGDMNGDGLVTDADAVYLLRYTLFPASYPVTQDADFNGDGQTTDADAVYLLRHTLFPGNYPLV